MSNQDRFSLLDIKVYNKSPIIEKIIWYWKKIQANNWDKNGNSRKKPKLNKTNCIIKATS